VEKKEGKMGRVRRSEGKCSTVDKIRISWKNGKGDNIHGV
jgi:hypothetical protein